MFCTKVAASVMFCCALCQLHFASRLLHKCLKCIKFLKCIKRIKCFKRLKCPALCHLGAWVPAQS